MTVIRRHRGKEGEGGREGGREGGEERRGEERRGEERSR